MSKKATKLAFLAAVMCGGIVAESASAAPLGYWRFEQDADASVTAANGVEIVEAVSEVNPGLMPGQMNATQPPSGNEKAPIYSNNVGGAFVYDPVTGLYTANSLSMQSPATMNASDDAQLYASGSAPTLDELRDSTFEMFIQITNNGAAANMAGSTRIANLDGSNRWNFNVNSNNVNFRVDTASANVASISEFGSPLEDGEWHHLAATVAYDEVDNLTTVELFIDYTSAGSQTAAGVFDPTSYLRFGADGSDGNLDWFFDEVRISDGVLTSSQFLQLSAVPEPGSFALIGLGAALTLARRRSVKSA